MAAGGAGAATAAGPAVSGSGCELGRASWLTPAPATSSAAVAPTAIQRARGGIGDAEAGGGVAGVGAAAAAGAAQLRGSKEGGAPSSVVVIAPSSSRRVPRIGRDRGRPAYGERSRAFSRAKAVLMLSGDGGVNGRS
ncbi:hypothetical protein AB5I41_09465 [Sphingomonas sp. MMS24-JH45]